MSEAPLAKKLRLLIEANGPITIAEYMSHCLGDPAHGYYMTRDPFGAGGDFITAPEVSQMFGEIIGAWLIEVWQLAGRPSAFHLVELGPGRGTLMADILRVASHVPEFLGAMTTHLIETSSVLRKRQRATLNRFATSIAWRSSLGEVPEGFLLLIANEFFDALPVRQFVRLGSEWRERVVGIGADGSLAFGVGAACFDQGPVAHDGAVLELRPAADILVAEIAHSVAAHGGAALIVDYGHTESALGETLQAVRTHQFVDPLATPGEADLTAHVDFAALARSARAAGARVHGPVAQRDFLLPLGLLERAGRLGTGADDAMRAALRAAVDRLVALDQMGSLFKVLALTQPGICPPPFAAAVDLTI